MKKRKTQWERAIERIQNYCRKHNGCGGCRISYKAIDDLEKIRPYEPNVVKAAWNIFGKSYEYRRKYVEYKANRMGKKTRTEKGLFEEDDT